MSRFAGMNLNFPTGTTARDRNREAEQLNLYNQKKPITVKPSTVKNQNVFTPMDKQVSPAISQKAFKKVYGEDAKQSGNVSQYRNLTDLMKANMDSLSGKIRIRDDRYPDREAYVPPGYDSDMVPFAVKISAGRLGMDPKKYMNMGLMDRVKNFGTEAKSMGQELTTGVGQAFDAGKQLVSNLPMFSMLSGFLGGGNEGQEVRPEVASSGIMQNQPFLYTDPTSLGGPTEKGTIYAEDRFEGPGYTVLEGGKKGITDYTGEGMSDEMRAYFMSLDPAGREAFLMQTGAEREEQMRGAKNLSFLGQYNV